MIGAIVVEIFVRSTKFMYYAIQQTPKYLNSSNDKTIAWAKKTNTTMM